MKELDSIPTEGQFVAIWEFQGKPWCSTYKINKNGKTFVYRDIEDDFFDVNFLNEGWSKNETVRFFSC
jgi:hypothetical protein